MKKILFVYLLLFISVLILIIFVKDNVSFNPNESKVQENQGFSYTNNTIDNSSDPKIIVQNLDTPWEMAFLNNGDLLITERSGSLVHVSKDDNNNFKRITVPGVTEIGEGGLLGIALDPDYVSNNYVYLYYTTGSGNLLKNKLDRFTYVNMSLNEQTNIIDNIPAGANHNGGRVAFSPDGFLFVTTGDAGNGNISQDVNSLGGKILRVNKDGTIPVDNPFSNHVYTYGHRNVQGLAWDDNGLLWATEHGPSGTATGYDEINLIS
jgi:glucose/arabinose dehydrogenase